MSPYFIGVDGGTEGVRAGIFDRQGNLISISSVQYQTSFPYPGWAEQNPEDWWQAFLEAISSVVKKSNLDPKKIIAMAVDTTCCSTVYIDKNFKPIRPSLIWMDVRSGQEAQNISKLNDNHLKVNGDGKTKVSAEWMIPKTLWVKKHEPENYKKATFICEYQDYINYQLTKRYTGCHNNLANRWHSSEGFPLSLLQKLELEDLLEKWPQEILKIGEPIGTITQYAAQKTGLSPDTQIIQGGVDACLGALGMGTVQAGQMALMTGSSHLQLGLTNKPFHAPGLFGTYKDSLIEGLHLIEGGQTSTGSIINWFKNMLPDEIKLSDWDKKAAKIPIGCEGVLVLDHFQGNRTPYADPQSKGMIVGLTIAHSPAHIFRAIMESVVFGTKLIFDTMENAGMVINRFAMAGGASKSPLWLQMHSDICLKEVYTTAIEESPILGCAMAAAIGSGVYDSLTQAAIAMVKIVKTIHPNKAQHERYMDFYEKYKKLYFCYKNLQQ